MYFHTLNNVNIHYFKPCNVGLIAHKKLGIETNAFF